MRKLLWLLAALTISIAVFPQSGSTWTPQALSPANTGIVPLSGYFGMPRFTTDNLPTPKVPGVLVWNTTASDWQYWTGSAWLSLSHFTESDPVFSAWLQNTPPITGHTDSTLTQSGTTLGLNLANVNLWSGLQSFTAGIDATWPRSGDYAGWMLYYQPNKSNPSYSSLNFDWIPGGHTQSSQTQTNVLKLTGVEIDTTVPIVYFRGTDSYPFLTSLDAADFMPAVDPGTPGNVMTSDGSNWTSATPSVAWGNVTGALSNQADLATALAAKEPSIASGTVSQYWRGDKTWQPINWLTSESDTLASVTARGATTSVASSFTGGLSASTVSAGSLNVQTPTTSTVGAIIKGSSSQTADLLQMQDSTGAVRAKFDNNANLTLGTASSIGALTFTGTGLNDATLGGAYSGAFNQTLRIKITTTGTPDKFDWSIDGGSTWAATGVSITSGPIALNNTGVTVTFGATTGHTLGDYWQATLNAPVGFSSVTNSINIGRNPVLRAFGASNTAIGIGAMSAGKNTGSYNTASGSFALQYNTTGSYNFANGMSALTSNTTGSYNVANGAVALASNTTGSYNTANGSFVLYDLGTIQPAGSFHVGTSYTIKTVGTTDFTLIGASSNTVGVVFTATDVGSGTGTATPNNTNNNTAEGYNTGRGIIYGTGNTILGANVTGLDAGLTNNIILANGTGAIKAQHDGSNWTLTGNVTATGSVTATQYHLSALNTAPASATDTGTTGEIRVTSDYIYVCVATNTWVRAALATW